MNNQRRGLTLIEIIVVIAVIAFSIALFTPGTVGARESARRAHCVNNMKQVGLAMTCYTLDHGSTPVHMYGSAQEVGDTSLGFSGCKPWLVHLLPYLEAKSIHDSMNFSYTQGWVNRGAETGPSPVDKTALGMEINAYVCPCDIVQNTGSGDPSVTSRYANFSYVANAGHPRNVLLPGDAPNNGNVPPLTGIIGMSRMYPAQGSCRSPAFAATTNLTVTMANITDGTSNTAAFSESLKNDGSGYSNDRRRLLNYTETALVEKIDVPAMAVVLDGVARPRNRPEWSIYKGLTWGYSDSRQKHVYAHLLPPNAPPINTYHSDTSRCSEGDGAMNPTSQHPGGVNVSMMDGSVRFVKNGIALEVWWALGTRAGGEAIPANAY